MDLGRPESLSADTAGHCTGNAGIDVYQMPVCAEDPPKSVIYWRCYIVIYARRTPQKAVGHQGWPFVINDRLGFTPAQKISENF